MNKPLSGKTVLLTGASRGVGVHIARTLAGAGADLILTARDQAKLQAVAAECAALEVKTKVIVADITRREERIRLLEEAGPVDVLVNNAGIEIATRLLDQTDEDVAAQLELNLVAPIDLTRRVLPGMIERKYGVIVNLSSMSGKSPTPYNSIYAATKFGQNGFTSSLAIELEGTGVHTGVVCPGFIAETGMWADLQLKPPAAFREVRPEKVAKGVLAVIAGAREVLVTAGPVRPLLALKELVPSLDAKVLRAMGVIDVLVARSDEVNRRRH